MATTTTLSFTADAAGIDLDGRRFFGPPSELATDDFRRREPIGWAVATEFNVNATGSGTVTISVA